MKRKILVIEDDFDAGTILLKILDEAGFDVQVLQEGTDIVAHKFETPDMFILDNKLPSIEGTALCKFLRLQSVTKEVPIIVISGDNSIADKVNAAGANHFLAKPFRKEQLLRIINMYFPVEFFALDEEVPAEDKSPG